MPEQLPILYMKTGCPWWTEAADFRSGHGIDHRKIDVNEDAFVRMRQLSGQTKAPMPDWHDRVMPDFGVDELKPFLRVQNVKLENS